MTTSPTTASSDAVLNQAQQAELTPSDVIDRLEAGNARWVAGALTARNHLAQIPVATAGQYPMAAVVSCVDSRVPVESVFDCGIGDLFVARVAGNFVNVDILGSLEFACHVSGSKVIVVLGHESCGAVKSAIDGVELGNITEMLAKITGAVEATPTDGDRTSANVDFVAAVAEANVRNTIERIRAESPILAQMEADGDLAIVGAVYQLSSGRVDFLDAGDA